MTSWDRNSEGAWRATWVQDGRLCWRIFHGYSRRDAVRLLAEYRRSL